MNENLLQYLWKYKIFSKLDFKDTDGNPIEILDFGTLNTNSGPDFSLAKNEKHRFSRKHRNSCEIFGLVFSQS